MEPREAELIESARRGSREALSELFERYWPLAWRAAYAVTADRAVADDAAQDAMQHAFRRLDQFDAERPFAPWLRRIAVNRAIDEVRRARRLSPHDDWPEELGPPLALARTDGLLGDVAAAVAALPPNKRIVVVLHYWLDYSVPEIAETLGVPQGTVASRLSRALADLRSRLEEHHEERPGTPSARSTDEGSAR